MATFFPRKFNIYVISHLRPQNVQKMQELIGQPCTWIVAPGEMQSYLDAGAVSVVEGGNLVGSRNKALELAFAEGAVCVQVSDDMKKIEKLDFSTKQKEVISFSEALEIYKKEIWYSPFNLYGMPPTANAFFVHKPRSLNAFIIGDFIVVKPSDIRFDPEFLLKEDYDFTAQHIKKYGGVMRFDDMLFTFQHYSNSGGVVSYRNDTLEAEMANKLMAKHPGLFRRNTTRKNEVILKAPKPRK